MTQIADIFMVIVLHCSGPNIGAATCEGVPYEPPHLVDRKACLAIGAIMADAIKRHDGHGYIRGTTCWPLAAFMDGF